MPDNQRGFNVSVFKAELSTKNILRPNLYNVEFSVPFGLIDGVNYTQNLDTVKTLEYWCEATSVPGLNLMTYQGQRYGYGSIEQRPIMPQYGEITFDFFFDAEVKNYTFFNDWMNMIVNTDMSQGMNDEGKSATAGDFTGANKINIQPFELSYRDTFVVDLSLYIYNQEGTLKRHITLRDAFPKALGEVRLAWADNNTYMRLPVIFAYTDWFTNKINPVQRELPPYLNDYYNN